MPAAREGVGVWASALARCSTWSNRALAHGNRRDAGRSAAAPDRIRTASPRGGGVQPPDGPLVQGAGGPIGSAANFEASTTARVEPTEGPVQTATYSRHFVATQ